ncbi:MULTISPECIES: exodeoxyribonuclease V subunit beta [unclassified Tatumella]|uniref:exodeoxyribonuclease V subunit beta n=1 Tax=unclassified Tatumella TaxID=2649542 RepID=UPI001BAE9649|nr:MULTISPECIES: exodeoxyribonuclease V subunit beta [unclassified Tatumella]MBS0876964.1 exodeoxyribonuclease V subunit beta [Tatumella sp. JGM82]MBS0890899.1 exodeoxyribonuclease V subunit beta [Tatumella sp. JGM94]MBS0901856.1 exodeoxyribonuclease V subunit beta [Tatumella sp. JGM100]
MNMQQAEALDPLVLPLQGQRLIEASAGTGKTYTIGILYLRLLLGLGGDHAFHRPLSVEEILVVTFTEAATAELRGRIRNNIHGLRIACIRAAEPSPAESGGALAEQDAAWQPLLAQITDFSGAAARLLAAERQMDEAAIFTIHGFCQRMLNMNAFESGMLFEQQLVENEQPLLGQAAADFWRRYCYPLDEDVARIVLETFSGPEHLLASLLPWLQGEMPVIKSAPAEEQSLTGRHEQNIQRINALKQAWSQAADDLRDIIEQSGVDKRSYSSKHLPVWLDKLKQWAATPTRDYQIPKELARFSQQVLAEKTKKGEVPQHPLFSQVGDFLQQPVTLYDCLVSHALREIRASVGLQKRQHALLSFDDLLSRLDYALQHDSGPALAESVRQRYPVAMIDEFQDTDPLQYRIFSTLYGGQPQHAMLLIGDPKQAIYAFRGADIFTYISARKEVSAHYTLGTNWRSSPGMITSVNRLFSATAQPFIFDEIPFQPVAASPKNHALSLRLDGVSQPAMRLWLAPGEGMGVSEYQQFMASQAANDIARWLIAGQQGTACFVDSQQREMPVTAADITVLVRSRQEAGLIREALQANGIASVYLSSRDSVYQTAEARELLWILQAVLAPEQERTLRTALATSVMGLDAAALEQISQHSEGWDAMTDLFAGWQQLWRQSGVLPMLRDVMIKQQLAENLLASEGGERRLTDIMHLGELLQEAAVQLDSPHALVRFLSRQILHPDINGSSQQLRLESDRHLVQIVTIHKSKGLEYPLVWLPFAASWRPADAALYHDRDSLAAVLDLQQEPQSMQLAEQERLAEDLRLLYVALTRSVWHCSIGVAPLFRGNRKPQGETDLHHSAIGYLLQQGQPASATELSARLTQLADDNIAISVADNPPAARWQDNVAADPQLASRRLTRSLNDFWRVTSYSGLQRHGSARLLDVMPGFDIDAAGEQQTEQPPQLTAHHFPRGAGPGTFLHSLFEQLDFSQPVPEPWLAEQVAAHGYPPHWVPVLQQWLETLLTTPLLDEGLSLSALPAGDRLAEMEFYLPIKGLLQPQALDALMRRYDPLSQQAAPVDFYQVQGMLKGFIDLVFRWQGKYYLLDYKSNWLGADSSAYTPQAMQQAMTDHRYDLQYQLYSLALHRYLAHRIPDYDYRQHFGGVFYLFLRGMGGEQPENGVFFTRPAEAFIQQLDSLFAGQEGVSDD